MKWLVGLILTFGLPGYAQSQSTEATATSDLPLALAPEESETPAPVAIEALSESQVGITKEIRSLEDSLAERRTALTQIRERLAFSKSRLEQLNAEYQGLQQRLETVGLDLSQNYANLLWRRLDRLEKQHLTDNLTLEIKTQLEAARIEQFRLEEFDAILLPAIVAGSSLAERRAKLLGELGDAVSSHVDALNEYFQTVNTTQKRILAYLSLVRQRLFWLPSTDPINTESLAQLAAAFGWLVDTGHWAAVFTSIPEAMQVQPVSAGVIILLLIALLVTRGRLKRRLIATGEDIGHVGRDRFANTMAALGYSVTFVIPGTLALLLAAMLVAGAGEFGASLSRGLGDSAFLFLLLGLVSQVARPHGLGESHFKWRTETLQAIRRGIPRLLYILVPVATLTPLTESVIGETYRDSLGRLIFALASMALAVFAHRVLRAGLTADDNDKSPRGLIALYLVAVITPLVLMGFSLYGYHYTAVQLEGTLFITICWAATVVLFYFLCLRALSVRERRLTLELLREQRAGEQALAAAREAADLSGEGLPTALDMPDMDLHAISHQSDTLLRVVAGVLIAAGLWLLWANVFPAFRVLDEITLWTVAPLADGGNAIAISLEDLVLALLFGVTTVLAAKNLPGALEVVVLSRMNLAPGTGYAIITLVTYVIIIMGVVISLGMLGAQWSKLQWLVAAMSVGLGFGLQEIVANFVSGIIILFERPIRVGDTVTVGGKTGTVSRIRIRATTLIDWDRKEQIVPNKTFVTQDLTNWTLSDSITRVIVRVGVAYASDVDEVQALLTEVATANKRVVEEPAPAVFCVGLGDSSINFELRVFVRSMVDIMPLSHEMHSAITKALRAANIEIPFPQRDIHVRTEG